MWGLLVQVNFLGDSIFDETNTPFSLKANDISIQKYLNK